MEEIFKTNNLKKTKAREMVLQIIKSENYPITAEEIYKKTFKKHAINLSTIYRTLNVLSISNVLIKQVRQDGIAYFQLNKHDHKHLIKCVHCGKEIPLDNCPLEELLSNISKKTHFEITSHNIELYGVCEDCKKTPLN